MSVLPPRMNRQLRVRHPDMVCWRVAAIYRCCIRFGKTKAWALDRLREISPEGRRDSVADNWWMDMAQLQQRYARLHREHQDANPLPIAA